jgi:hypothetical protein
MTGNNDDNAKQTGKPADTDASLQSELSREAAEGSELSGDVMSNRNLSGSSSWETLPDESDATGSVPKTAKGSGQSKGPAGGVKD